MALSDVTTARLQLSRWDPALHTPALEAINALPGSGPLPQRRRPVYARGDRRAVRALRRALGALTASASGPSTVTRHRRDDRLRRPVAPALVPGARGRGRGRLAPAPARLGQRIRHRGRPGRACRRARSRPLAHHRRDRPGQRPVDRRREPARPRPRADAPAPAAPGRRLHLRAGAVARRGGAVRRRRRRALAAARAGGAVDPRLSDRPGRGDGAERARGGGACRGAPSIAAAVR